MSDNRTPLITAGVAAKLLNLTERRVQQLAKDGIIPKAERGKYELVRIVPAYVRYLQDRAINQDCAPTDYHAEKLRLIRAQAEKAEFESALMRKTSVPVDDVERHWMEIVSASRAKLLSLPQSVAQVAIAGKDIREVEEAIRSRIYDALSELGEGIPESDAGMDSTTGIDSGGMGAEEPVSKPGSKRGTRKVAKRAGKAHDSADGVVESE